jgi:large repetitive protein
MRKVGLRLATPVPSLILLLLNGLAPAIGQEQPLLVVYGPKASTADGDHDYRDIIYFRVPADVTEPLYLRVFDMETGGDNDLVYGAPGDTQTRFTLFGGTGAASMPALPPAVPTEDQLRAGTVLLDEIVGERRVLDNKWHTLARVTPDQGERV